MMSPATSVIDRKSLVLLEVLLIGIANILRKQKDLAILRISAILILRISAILFEPVWVALPRTAHAVPATLPPW